LCAVINHDLILLTPARFCGGEVFDDMWNRLAPGEVVLMRVGNNCGWIAADIIAVNGEMATGFLVGVRKLMLAGGVSWSQPQETS
jgi:hypothetical protein